MAWRTILVADDDPGVLDLFERLLPPDWRLLRARDGREAVDVARAEQPSVVFLDLRMPAIGGLEALRQLRSAAGGRSIPIFVLSSEQGGEARRTVLAAGARGFLSKPITRRVLVDLLEGLDRPAAGGSEPRSPGSLEG